MCLSIDIGSCWRRIYTIQRMTHTREAESEEQKPDQHFFFYFCILLNSFVVGMLGGVVLFVYV